MTFLRHFFLFIPLSVCSLTLASRYSHDQLVATNPFWNSMQKFDLEHMREGVDKDLWIATLTGDLEKMQKAIHAGAGINSTMGQDQPWLGKTLLSVAIESCSVNAAALLLSNGASVEDMSDIPFEINKLMPRIRGVPQISYAIIVNTSPEIIELLIHYSKNINETDMYVGWTPYKVASVYQNTKAMELLAKAGADTDISIPNSNNPNINKIGWN